tara:strand:+ start:39 stop:425 length:387 start_codon:yes stop_codon:yes gene_type:complete
MGGYEMAGFRKNVGGVLARKSYEETLRDTVPTRMATRVDHKRNNLDKMLKDLYSLATSGKVRFYTEYFGQKYTWEGAADTFKNLQWKYKYNRIIDTIWRVARSGKKEIHVSKPQKDLMLNNIQRWETK